MDEPTPHRSETDLRIVGVKFRVAGQIHDFDAGNLELVPGELVVVEGDRGTALATVATPVRPWTPEPGQPGRPLRVLKRADDRDLARDDVNHRQEKETHRFCVAMLAERRLPIKLVKVEYGFDGTKATIYFFAENRVDFREFVRDVSNRLRMRIEMKQIGARDETKLVGALGPCGRELCCSSWLREFHAVSLKMAKEQELSLNPSKLAGMCGRLKCCLRYEYETYLEIRRGLPRLGEKVMCVKGDGVVVRHVILRESVVVRRDDDGTEVEATLEDLVRRKETV